MDGGGRGGTYMNQDCGSPPPSSREFPLVSRNLDALVLSC